MDNRKTKVINDKKTKVINENRKTVVIKDNDRSTIVLNGEKNTYFEENLIGLEIEGFIFNKIISNNSGQSIVYLVVKNNKKYVCKLYHNDSTVIDKEVVDILSKLDSPYVIKIIKYGIYNNHFYTITPYYEEGPVIEHIEEIDIDLLKNKYINELNEGLNTIHQAGILHCDIKPHNIYFYNNYQDLIIADFGISLPLNQFDTIKTQYGDAVAKRDLQKNNVTIAYLAQEGEEYATRAVDYFALGMTILNMAHRGDIYSDVSDEVIRDKLVLEGVRIPDNVDKEVASLVSKMLETDSKTRLDYNGVKKWCNDKTCYLNGGQYILDIKNAVVNTTIIHNTKEYIETLQNDPLSIEYYKVDGVINDLIRNKADEALIKEIKDIKNSYKDNLEYGLLLTELTLDRNLKFKYKDLSFSNLKSYIAYLDKALLSNNYFFDIRIITKEIQNEILSKRLSNENKINEIWSKIVLSNFDNRYKAEMLRNYFTLENNIVLNEKMYKLSDIAYLLFDNNLVPNDNKKIFNDMFLDLLLNKFIDEENKNKIKEIFSNKDIFVRNSKLSLFLTNNIKCTICNYKISNFLDITSVAKDLYEKRKDSTEFVKLLKNKLILKYYLQFEENDDKIIDLLKYIASSTMNYDDSLAYFYNATQENAIFKLDRKTIKNLDELYLFLADNNKIELYSDKLMNSLQFRIWLKGLGYEECVNYIDGGNKK